MFFRKDEFNDVPADAQGRTVLVRAARQPLAVRIGAGLLGLLLLFGFAYWLFGGGKPAAEAMPPAEVAVAVPLQREIVEYDEFTGRFEPSRSVEIRPRVSGQLQAIHFRDGQYVRQGQVLFTIDPRPFAAALAEAQARAAAARTAAALARSELARALRLLPDEAVSREEVENLRAAEQSAEANIAAADAVVRQRALDLEFTRVRAPIAGRVSDRRVDVGNLVGGMAESATHLTTIHAVDPIYFTFEASEAVHLKYLRQGTAAQAAEVRLQDEAGYRWKGRIDFTDNEVDPNSGTVRGRVVLANPSGFLTPGMFGNMRLSAGAAREALLVPDAAVQSDQARKIVLVVGRDGTVAAKPVEPGARIGEFRSIRAGLGADDRVIVAGTQFAQPGAKVETRPTRLTLPTRPSAPRGYTPPPPSQATIAL